MNPHMLKRRMLSLLNFDASLKSQDTHLKLMEYSPHCSKDIFAPIVFLCTHNVANKMIQYILRHIHTNSKRSTMLKK